MPIRPECGARTHKGLVREVNEDGFLSDPRVGLWAVADGMGGHQAGAFASDALIDALQTVGQPATAANFLERLEDRVIRANLRIFEYAAARGLGAIGTTLSALLLYKRGFAVVWCGDSRIYRVRDREIELLSHDHTEVQELLDTGFLSPSEAKRWPRGHVVTRAIGSQREPSLDFEWGTVSPGDTFVLCSDGLTAHVENHEIRDACLGPFSAQTVCDRLIDMTLARGASDNVTVVTVKC